MVQLDCLDSLLLVSTLTKCFLCDTGKEQFWTVGAKPRNGAYGACFFQPEMVELSSTYAVPRKGVGEVGKGSRSGKGIFFRNSILFGEGEN